jgi:hypothetical protein
MSSRKKELVVWTHTSADAGIRSGSGTDELRLASDFAASSSRLARQGCLPRSARLQVVDPQ